MFKKMVKIQNNIINSEFIKDIDIDNLNISINQDYSGEGRITFKGKDKINNQNVELSIGISKDLLSIWNDLDTHDKNYTNTHTALVEFDKIVSINISKNDLVRSYAVGDAKVYIYRVQLPNLFDAFYYTSDNNDRVLKENPYNLDIVSSNLYNDTHEVKLALYKLTVV